MYHEQRSVAASRAADSELTLKPIIGFRVSLGQTRRTTVRASIQLTNKIGVDEAADEEATDEAAAADSAPADDAEPHADHRDDSEAAATRLVNATRLSRRPPTRHYVYLFVFTFVIATKFCTRDGWRLLGSPPSRHRLMKSMLPLCVERNCFAVTSCLVIVHLCGRNDICLRQKIIKAVGCKRPLSVTASGSWIFLDRWCNGAKLCRRFVWC